MWKIPAKTPSWIVKGGKRAPNPYSSLFTAVMGELDMGIDKWIFNDPEVIGAAVGLAIQPIWLRCVIRRTLNSRIPFRSGRQVGEKIPSALIRRSPALLS